MKYRKTALVEAAQMPADGEYPSEELLEILHRTASDWEQSGRDGTITIHTLEGDLEAQPGDWIIEGAKGEIYPCKPDIFAATYEPA